MNESLNEISKILQIAKTKNLDFAISAPPCGNCKFFRPQAIFRQYENSIGQQFDGMRICWANQMYHDFSCWQSNQ